MSINTKSIVRIDYNAVFVKLCIDGNLDEARAFYITYNLDINTHIYKTFMYALYNRQLHIASWLYDLSEFSASPIRILLQDFNIFDELYNQSNLESIIWLLSKYTEIGIIMPFDLLWNSMKKYINLCRSFNITRHLMQYYAPIISQDSQKIYYIVNLYCKRHLQHELEWLENLLDSDEPQLDNLLRLECILATNCKHFRCFSIMYNWLALSKNMS
jgi:hypothetical protein